MDIELLSRSSRWEISMKNEKEAARKKKEKELNEKRKREKLEQETRELNERRAAEREIAEAAAEEERQKEFHLTGGIKFSERLQPVLLEDAEDDKIVLPQSALESLNSQDALSAGVLMFRITVLGCSNKISHCGVREFTAAEGTVALPPKVSNSLFGETDQPKDNVQIKYVRLPKITYVKLQPKEHQFSNVGPIKAVLEENLRRHTTLSIDDVLTVWYRGKAHALKVVEIKPEMYGSLIDTDVEVDLDVSEEYQKHVDDTAASSSSTTTSYSAKYQKLSESSPQQPTDTDVDAADVMEVEESIANTVPVPSSLPPITLPPEPASDDINTIVCRIRDPSGTFSTRKFNKTQPMNILFDYVRTQSNNNNDGSRRRIQLTARAPTRVYTSDASFIQENKSFEDMGVTSSQETFLLSFV
eukprot:gene10420-21729_t